MHDFPGELSECDTGLSPQGVCTLNRLKALCRKLQPVHTSGRTTGTAYSGLSLASV